MTRGTFPLRVGAIDVGTNAIRFVVAEFSAPDRWVELEYLREPVRLGHGAFVTGQLGEEAMTAAVQAMGAFRNCLDAHGTETFRAVATSAVRESRNGDELVARIRAATGIRLETITGREEARLTWTAARTRVPLDRELWMMADLGGGSLELALASGEGILRFESHPLGTVRILEDLADRSRNPRHLRELVTERAAGLRIPDHPPGARPLEGLLATGGNIETLSELASGEPDGRGVGRLSRRDLGAWIDRLASLSSDGRVEELGLRPDRADVILPAAILYDRVAALSGVDEIHVPHVGVKEGVLVDLVKRLVEPRPDGSNPTEPVYHPPLRDPGAVPRDSRASQVHLRRKIP